MNEKEIFEMTKHINDEYILEAAASPRTSIKLKKRIITFAAAAALTASLSIGAFAAYKAFNKESVGTYYDSSAVEKIEPSPKPWPNRMCNRLTFCARRWHYISSSPALSFFSSFGSTSILSSTCCPTATSTAWANGLCWSCR